MPETETNKIEATAAQMESEARSKMIAEGNAQRRLAEEQDAEEPWYKKKLDDTLYSLGISDHSEKVAYETTKRFVMMLLGKNSKPPKPVEKATGVTKGKVAPLNGNMKNVASGVSKAVKNGVKPNMKPTPVGRPAPNVTMKQKIKKQPKSFNRST